MRGCLEHSEKQCKKLLEQLSVVKKGYDSQIAEMKLVCDQRITVLDRMLANKEQVSALVSCICELACYHFCSSRNFKILSLRLILRIRALFPR